MEPGTYLQALISPLLRHPEDLNITSVADNLGVLYTVNVHKEDMGVIIGKKGETANAIRHLVRIVGLIAKARVSIKISDPV